MRKRTCAYQGVRNVSFSKHFVHVLNESSLTEKLLFAASLSHCFTDDKGFKLDATDVTIALSLSSHCFFSMLKLFAIKVKLRKFFTFCLAI